MEILSTFGSYLCPVQNVYGADFNKRWPERDIIMPCTWFPAVSVTAQTSYCSVSQSVVREFPQAVSEVKASQKLYQTPKE
jgi:hypothetical protein